MARRDLLCGEPLQESLFNIVPIEPIGGIGLLVRREGRVLGAAAEAGESGEGSIVEALVFLGGWVGCTARNRNHVMTIDELKNRNKIYKYSKYPHKHQSVASSNSD